MVRMENACDIRRCGLSYVYSHDDAATAASTESQLILYHLDIYVNLKKQMFKKHTESIWYGICLFAMSMHNACIYVVCDATEWSSLDGVQPFSIMC